MSVFVISDLHLSTLDSTNKSMEVFGQRWADYTNRLEQAWRRLVDEHDTVIIAGDISWALTLEEATSDLLFIESLPGQKILIKGNHDFWWQTASKLQAFCARHHLDSLHFLHNNAFLVEDFVICGSRGWYHDSDAEGAKQALADYDKIVNRECIRLKLSLDQAHALAEEAVCPKEMICFLHFPPIWCEKECAPILSVLKEYGVDRLYFGHIHGAVPTTFTHENIEMTLTAADALGFVPKLISPQIEGK
ncbi:MAG: metallophosphoesterase [Clostridia bacterium]|nr:metallophosphoesterase [Clostridia bacterium]